MCNSQYDFDYMLYDDFFAGVMAGHDLQSGMPGLLAAGDHCPHQVVKDRGVHAGGEGQLHRLALVYVKKMLLRRGTASQTGPAAIPLPYLSSFSVLK